MRLRRLKIEKSSAGGGLFNGLDVWFGRDTDGKSNEPLAPLCLIGPNGSGKSQFLQLLAEIFQAAWHEHSPQEERTSANTDMLFELDYLISPNGKGELEEVALVRTKKGRSAGPIELYRKGEELPISAESGEFGNYLPSIVVGYTSGDNETLSLPFLVSRSGYAQDVYSAAKKDSKATKPRDNRLTLIDYGTNLEVLLANMLLNDPERRLHLLDHAKLKDLASLRCIVRLNPSAGPSGGVLLTDELSDTINNLISCATCWSYIEKGKEYTFDFLVDNEMRKAFGHFWSNTLGLYRSLHKLALLNDLAIPKKARSRMERAVKERRFATRLPEPQQENMVFAIEEVRFWPLEGGIDAVDYVSLSDGEHQQALILGSYAMVEEANALFLLDEPESHFNPQWRVRFVQRLMELTNDRGPQELLMTTHAPFVPSDMPREQVLIFAREDGKIVVKQPKIETFGATFDRILETCFEIRPPMSRIAGERIEELLKSDDVSELERGLQDLGPSVKKAFVADHLRRLKEPKS